MKKTWLLGVIVGVLLLLCAWLTYYSYTVRPIPVYGEMIPVNTKEIAIPGDRIGSVDELIDVLSPFSDVAVLDLGDFPVSVREEDKLRAAFPGATLTYARVVDLYGDAVPCGCEELDLSDKDLSDLGELREAIPYLPDLKRVVSTGAAIPLEERRALSEAFPRITFSMVALTDVYGLSVRDDVTRLDLSGVTVDKGLAAVLASLPALTEVDLYGSGFTAARQLELIRACPGIDFGWEVEILGKKYDSLTEDLDLSGQTRVTPALVREKAVLFPRLKRIDLSDCGASNEALAALREALPGVKVVWRITMGEWSLKTDAVAFSVLIFNYDHERLTSEDIQVLKYCTDLQALDLGHQAITDISVIGDYLPELRILILVDNLVSDLTPVAKLKHLHYIELFVNSYLLTDISPLADCKELVDVNISYLYRVTDFSPLYDLPMLERLWMEHTKVTEEDLAILKARHPQAEIVTEGEGSVDQGWREHERYFAMIDMYHKNYMSGSFSKYDR